MVSNLSSRIEFLAIVVKNDGDAHQRFPLILNFAYAFLPIDFPGF